MLTTLLATLPRPDPFPLYAELHQQGESFRSPLGTVYLVSHARCSESLRDPRLAVEDAALRARHRPGWADEAWSPFFDSLLFLNGADHRAVKTVAQSLLVPRALRLLEEGLETATDEVLGALAGAAKAGEAIDVCHDVAWPLQLYTLSTFLGVGPGELDFLPGLMPRLVVLGSPLMWHSADDAKHAAEASRTLVAFFKRIIEQRSELAARLGARWEHGLVHRLLASADAGGLDTSDVLATLVAVVVAGVETTIGLIANAVVEILRDPRGTDFGDLRGPDSTPFVEEVIRLAAPIHIVGRRALESGTVVAGHEVPAGAHVVLLLGAALRDPAMFPEPNQIDPTRAAGSSLAFGSGPHYCLGAALARIQLRAVVGGLFTRYPQLRLSGEPQLGRHLNPHSYSSVPVLLA